MEARYRPADPAETTPSWAAGSRRRIPFYLAAAALLAGLAGFLTFVYLDQVRASSLPSRSAVVALQDIRPGTVLEASMLDVRLVPETILPVGALGSPSQAIGRVVTGPLAAREIILPSDLAGSQSGLSSRLPDGRWAMVLPSGWLATPFASLSAGERIDLLAYASGTPLEQAAVIVTAVEVLDVFGDAEHPEGLVLAVTLDQATAILYTRSNGFAILPLLRPAGE
jgi:Flp pilus assembly protein CpaB